MRGSLSRIGLVLLALLASVSPVLAGQASAVTSAINVGNTGDSTKAYADNSIAASSAGVAFLRSTPQGRSATWYGVPSGGSLTTLTGLPPATNFDGIQGSLAVVTDYSNGNVDWENLDGTGQGSGPPIPASAPYGSYDYGVSAAPGGWVTVGESMSDYSAHLLQVSTGGTVIDLGALPSAPGYNFVAGPNGVIYQTVDYATTPPRSLDLRAVFLPHFNDSAGRLPRPGQTNTARRYLHPTLYAKITMLV